MKKKPGLSKVQQREIARLHSISHRSHEKRAIKIINQVFTYYANSCRIFVNSNGIRLAITHLPILIKPEVMKKALESIWFSVASDYSKIGRIYKDDGTKPGKTLHQTYMERYANSEGAARKVKDITDTTRERLLQTLQESATAKLSKSDTAKAIKESTGFSKKRSLLIARTETTTAANMGAMESASKSGLQLLKYWIAADDDRTREAHAEMVGSEGIPMDESFEVGDEEMMYPGDPTASAANLCNCRCVVAFRPIPASEVDNSDEEESPVLSREEDTAVSDALIALINLINSGEETEAAINEAIN